MLVRRLPLSLCLLANARWASTSALGGDATDGTQDMRIKWQEVVPKSMRDQANKGEKKDVHEEEEDDPLKTALAPEQTEDETVRARGPRFDPNELLPKKSTKRAKSMDDILGDILHDAMAKKDQGEQPNTDSIYKSAQERLYEQEHGRKPTSSNPQAQQKYLPFPPDLQMARLEPVHAVAAHDETTMRTSYQRCSEALDDPWPQRAITSENPILTRAELEKREKAKIEFEKSRSVFSESSTGEEEEEESEALQFDDYKRMYRPRPGFDPVSEFVDAIDEHFFWEKQYIVFIRDAPLWQRRSLPYLHEHYRLTTHRLVRAENRFIACRDKALAAIKASAQLFARTEDRIERSRQLCAETHRSLSSPNYDPARRKKKTLAGDVLNMSNEDFASFWEKETFRKNSLIGNIIG